MTILENGLYVEDLKKAVSKLDLSQASHKSFIVTGGLGLICSTIVDLLIMANYVQNLNIRIYVAARNKIKFIHRYKHFKNVEFEHLDDGSTTTCRPSRTNHLLTSRRTWWDVFLFLFLIS